MGESSYRLYRVFFPSQICCQILNIFRLFLKVWVYFQAFKNSYPQERSGKHEKNLKLKVLVSEKKISSDTEIGLWFRFPIPKPSFGRTLAKEIDYQQLQSDLILIVSVS